MFRCWCLKAIYFQFQFQESPIKTHKGRLAIFGWHCFLEHKLFFCLTGRRSVSLTQLMPELMEETQRWWQHRKDGQVCSRKAGTSGTGTSSSPEGRQSHPTPTLHPELLCQHHPSAAGQKNDHSQAGSQLGGVMWACPLPIKTTAILPQQSPQQGWLPGNPNWAHSIALTAQKCPSQGTFLWA